MSIFNMTLNYDLAEQMSLFIHFTAPSVTAMLVVV
jgi:hypothetical protein